MVGLYGGAPLEYAAINEQGTEAVPSSTGDVLGAAFGEGLAANLFPRMMRSQGRFAAETGLLGVDDFGRPIMGEPEPTIDSQTANTEFGIKGHLSFDKPVPRSVAQDLFDHKREAIEREDVIARREGGILTGGVSRFATGIAAGLLDPINLAAGFIPFVGEARMASVLGRGAVEAMGVAERAGVRAATGAGQGALSMAALQPLEFSLSREEHEDYTMAMALRSIALGSVIGGGMHAGIGAALDRAGGRYRNPIAQGLEDAGPDAREGMLRGALAQTIEGRPVEVAPALDALRAAEEGAPIAAEARPAEVPAEAPPEVIAPPALTERATAGFTTAKGSTYELHEDGTTTRDKSFHPEHGAADVGLKPRSAKTIYVDSEERATALSGAGLSGAGPRGFRLLLRDGKATLISDREIDGRWGVSPSSRDIPFSTEPAVGKYPVEMWGARDDVPGYPEVYARQHAGNEITEIRQAPPATPPLEGGIAGDMSRKLTAAGRPLEEAQAAGQVVQALYETHAARFNGAKGTAEDLYRAEAPDVVRGRQRVAEMAQAGELGQAGHFTFDRVIHDGPIPRDSNVFVIRDSAGEAVARAHIIAENDRAYIQMIDTAREGDPGRLLGPSAMRGIARSFFEAFPDVQVISGERVSGARHVSGAGNPGDPATVTITRDQVFGAGRRSLRELGQAGKTVEVGGHELPLNDDGTVTLYHATKTAEQADAIIAGKTLKSGGEPSVYLSTAREGTGYGDHVVAVKVDPKLLRIDDAFPDGRADFAIDRPSAQVTDAARPGRELGQEAAPPGEPARLTPRDVERVRDLTVLDILDPATPALRARSRGVEEIAAELEARGKRALRALGVKEGKITGPSPRTDEILSHAISAEVRAALQRSGHAGDWYTTKVEEAVATAARLYPEIATDPNARSSFTAALAVTSQGETVVSNVRLADQVYRRFRNNGRFPEDVEAKNGAAMNANFAKLNDLIDRLGHDGARELLSREFTVRELERELGVKIGGENKDTKVYGSMILGPKIGQGFYQNLNGNFRPVTMDLWFMRAWGRLTGTLVGLSEEAVAKQRTRLTNALADAGERVPKTAKALEARAEAIVKEHERNYRKYRAEYDSGERIKSESVHAATAYMKGLRGINEQPTSGAQRVWMRDRINRAREILAEEGTDLTNADMQAAWWYPEKELHGKLGGRDAAEVNVDYSTAWRDVARSRGLSDAELPAEGAGSVRALDRRSGPAGTADDAGAAAEVSRGSGAADGAQEFYQSRRGKIRLAGPEAQARATITLFRDADASTFIHETGHDWLERLTRDAADPQAPTDLVADVATVRDWLGVKEGEARSTEAHEKFATGFEQYLRDGRAPTPELQGVFDKFKEWLVKIYRTLTGLGEPINDDIRGVFDRMLATDEQIARPTETSRPIVRDTAPRAERAPAAGEPGGPRPSDTAAEITAQAEQLESMRRGPAASTEARAAAEPDPLAAEAESHARAAERAAFCIMRG